MNSPIRISLVCVFLSLLTYIGNSQSTAKSTITFVQDLSTYPIGRGTGTVELNREPFSIRYFCKPYNGKKGKFYAAQVAVLTNAQDTAVLQVGQDIESIPYFQMGTGMAPGENGLYDAMFITNTGHHYLFYENEKDKRVSLVSRTEKLLELEWKISSAFYDEKDVQLSELNQSELFFAILIDNNLNSKIDKGEYQIIQVKFK